LQELVHPIGLSCAFAGVPGKEPQQIWQNWQRRAELSAWENGFVRISRTSRLISSAINTSSARTAIMVVAPSFHQVYIKNCSTHKGGCQCFFDVLQESFGICVNNRVDYRKIIRFGENKEMEISDENINKIRKI
jgi:hypothetical protein